MWLYLYMVHQIQIWKSLRWPWNALCIYLIIKSTVSVLCCYVPNVIKCVWVWSSTLKTFCFCHRMNDLHQLGCISTHFTVWACPTRLDSICQESTKRRDYFRLWPRDESVCGHGCGIARHSTIVIRRQTTVRLPSTCSLIELFSFPLIYQWCPYVWWCNSLEEENEKKPTINYVGTAVLSDFGQLQ